MPAKKRYQVTATMIVAKVPGAQGGEVYLRRGRILPDSVEAAEVKRLIGLGLVGVAPDEPDADANAEAEAKAAAEAAAAAAAEAEAKAKAEAGTKANAGK